MASAVGLCHRLRLNGILVDGLAPVTEQALGVARRGVWERALGVISAGMAVSLALATVNGNSKA